MAGIINFDSQKRVVVRDGKKIHLSPKECNLLEYFLENKNNILKRRKLLETIWRYAPDIDSRVVDVYVGYLRKKIDKDFSKKLIHSIRGLGYMFKE